MRESACSRGIAALGCVRLVGRIFWRSLTQKVQSFSRSPFVTRGLVPPPSRSEAWLWLSFVEQVLQRGYKAFRALPSSLAGSCHLPPRGRLGGTRSLRHFVPRLCSAYATQSFDSHSLAQDDTDRACYVGAQHGPSRTPVPTMRGLHCGLLLAFWGKEFNAAMSEFFAKANCFLEEDVTFAKFYVFFYCLLYN